MHILTLIQHVWLQVVCEVLEGDFCRLKYYHTLVGGKGIGNMESVYNINNTITAMDILQTSNFYILYFGTIDGELGRVCTEVSFI